MSASIEHGPRGDHAPPRRRHFGDFMQGWCASAFAHALIWWRPMGALIAVWFALGLHLWDRIEAERAATVGRSPK